ncbi:TPA: hypothetical protein ACT9ME_001609 [Legionella pneumophila]
MPENRIKWRSAGMVINEKKTTMPSKVWNTLSWSGIFDLLAKTLLIDKHTF